MNDDLRSRVRVYLRYLEIALRDEYGGDIQHEHIPTDFYKTKNAFERARDELSISLSLNGYDLPHLIAGITMNCVSTLLWSELGHLGHTRWHKRGLTSGSILLAVQKVYADLDVTAV